MRRRCDRRSALAGNCEHLRTVEKLASERMRSVNGTLTTSQGVQRFSSKSGANQRGKFYQPARRPMV